MVHMICAVDGCPHPVRTRGWCNRHYQRWRRYGDPTFVVQAQEHDTVRRMRAWVVIAAVDPDDQATWRVKLENAASSDEAVAAYQTIFDYPVVGVGNLEGSGHLIRWSA